MLKHLLSGPPALQLAVAESMTGGRLQALITAESGASAFFLGGLTAYTLAQKIRHLGVAREIAEPVDCVSAEVALQMARGAGAFFGADLAMATTGYAEPNPDRGFPTPGVHWALCHRLPDNREVHRAGFLALAGASREQAQQRAARAAYAALTAYLETLRGEPSRPPTE